MTKVVRRITGKVAKDLAAAHAAREEQEKSELREKEAARRLHHNTQEDARLEEEAAAMEYHLCHDLVMEEAQIIGDLVDSEIKGVEAEAAARGVYSHNFYVTEDDLVAACWYNIHRRSQCFETKLREKFEHKAPLLMLGRNYSRLCTLVERLNDMVEEIVMIDLRNAPYYRYVD